MNLQVLKDFLFNILGSVQLWMEWHRRDRWLSCVVSSSDKRGSHGVT